MPPTALEARDAAKTYPNGVRALDGVSLDVRTGETVALIGKSGCGKSTLLRLFNRLEEPTGGEVLIGGKPARDLHPIRLRRRTGYLQQEPGLLPHWTVRKNVALVPKLLGWDPGRIRVRVAEILDLVGLDPDGFQDRYPLQLSGGERQRVAFARGLAADPEVILLDEPFAALDALTRLEMHKEFLHLKEVLGKTMVLVTHDLDEAFRLADRIAVMKDGRIHQVASPEVLRREPATDYVAELIGRARDPSS